jgi:hypothetical protein
MSVAEKTPPHLTIFSSCELKEKKKGGFVVTKLQICSSPIL